VCVAGDQVNQSLLIHVADQWNLTCVSLESSLFTRWFEWDPWNITHAALSSVLNTLFDSDTIWVKFSELFCVVVSLFGYYLQFTQFCSSIYFICTWLVEFGFQFGKYFKIIWFSYSGLYLSSRQCGVTANWMSFLLVSYFCVVSCIVQFCELPEAILLSYFPWINWYKMFVFIVWLCYVSEDMFV